MDPVNQKFLKARIQILLGNKTKNIAHHKYKYIHIYIYIIVSSSKLRKVLHQKQGAFRYRIVTVTE